MVEDRLHSTYRTLYRLADGPVLYADSLVAFPVKDEVERAIGEAGLAAKRWLGDWSGAEWSPEAAEIIALGRWP